MTVANEKEANQCAHALSINLRQFTSINSNNRKHNKNHTMHNMEWYCECEMFCWFVRLYMERITLSNETSPNHEPSLVTKKSFKDLFLK